MHLQTVEVREGSSRSLGICNISAIVFAQSAVERLVFKN